MLLDLVVLVEVGRLVDGMLVSNETIYIVLRKGCEHFDSKESRCANLLLVVSQPSRYCRCEKRSVDRHRPQLKFLQVFKISLLLTLRFSYLNNALLPTTAIRSMSSFSNYVDYCSPSFGKSLW